MNLKKEHIGRRCFITQMASASAFAMMAPKRALGSVANARVKVGVVGLGGRGMWIAQALHAHEGYEVVSVADYFSKRSAERGKALGVAKEKCFSGLRGYQGVMESDVDAVFLETPPCFFPEHAAAAVAAGHHVYMAKPVACDVPGTLAIGELGEACSKRDKVFLVDFQTRTDPFYIEAMKRVHGGALGEIGLIACSYFDNGFDDPPLEDSIENRLRGLIWVNDTALGCAFIGNCDIHAIDVGLWIANDLPRSATGCSARRRPNPHGDSRDNYAIAYEFENGLIMDSHSEHLKNGTTFGAFAKAYGQDAFLETGYHHDVKIISADDSRQYAGGNTGGLYEQGMLRNLDTFHRSIIDGVYANPTVEPSVNATLAAILGRNAALEGRKITWREMLKDTTRLEVDTAGLKQG
jgi:myo-inositol 2-dehydrogenase / D-chiro-inositol 1-dehydrogenase